MQRVLEDLSLPAGCLVVPGEWLHVSKARRWTSRGSCGHLLLLEVVKLSPTQERAEGRRRGVTSCPILIKTRAARSRVLSGSALIVWV